MATTIPGTGLPPTARLKRTTMHTGAVMSDDVEATTLRTSDVSTTDKAPLYIYNLCELSHVRNQPPEFPSFRVDPCPKGQKFSVRVFPAIVNERYVKPGTSEFYYIQVDGRKYATSLLNPDCYPGTEWERQLVEGTTGNDDMSGMNMNALGVFWSELAPDDPKLNDVIARFRARVDRTLDGLVKEGNRFHAEGQPGRIGGLHHFAMDYFGLSAQWHMSNRHKIECPNCGDLVLEGIAYHRNSSGDICIIDHERYEKAVIPSAKQKESPAESPAPAAARRSRTRTAQS